MTIQDTTALLLENPRVVRAEKSPKLTAEERIVEAFREAYKKNFGVYPHMSKNGEYYRVHSYSSGMNARRLKQLTSNLKQRDKDHDYRPR